MSAQNSIYQLLAEGRANSLHISRKGETWKAEMQFGQDFYPKSVVGEGSSVEEACFECMEAYRRWWRVCQDSARSMVKLMKSQLNPTR